MNAPPLNTRQPTGLPPWPIGLIAGVEGSGKSWKLAEASASSMVHRTLWIGCGEEDPDEYGVVGGARFEIVTHDGTYRGVLAACEAACAQAPGPNGEPNLIVLDSGSRLWHQMADNAQQTANERAKRKNKPVGDDGVQITMDLWNTAKDRWGHIIDTFRSYDGPVLITSRLDLVTIVDGRGEPTKEKRWKVSAEKNLPYEVGFVVQMRASFPEHDTWLTKVKSARYKHKTDTKGAPVGTALDHDWSIEQLWTRLGLTDQVGVAVHPPVVKQGETLEVERLAELLDQIRVAATGAGVDLGAVAAEWAETHNGQPIRDTSDFGGLECLLSGLRQRAGAVADPAAATGPQGPAEPPADDEAPPEAQEEGSWPAPVRAPADQEPDPGPAAEVPAVPPARVDPEQALIGDVLAELAACQSVADARVVWTRSKPVRAVEIDDIHLGRRSIGQLIMERQKVLAGARAPQERDHAERAAGETAAPTGPNLWQN